MSASTRHPVFLSYSRRDLDLMHRVRDALQDEGLGVWTDEKIEPGTPQWNQAIEEAMKTTGCMVIILTPNTLNSEGVLNEIHFAKIHHVRIFSLLAKGNERESVPYPLAGNQWVDIRTDFKGGLSKLSETLGEYLRLETRTIRERREYETRVAAETQQQLDIQKKRDEEKRQKEIEAEAQRRAQAILKQERQKQQNRVQPLEQAWAIGAALIGLLLLPIAIFLVPERLARGNYSGKILGGILGKSERRVKLIAALVIGLLAVPPALFAMPTLDMMEELGFERNQTEVIFVIILPVFTGLVGVYNLAMALETALVESVDNPFWFGKMKRSAVFPSFGIGLGVGIGMGVQTLLSTPVSFLNKLITFSVWFGAGIVVTEVVWVVLAISMMSRDISDRNNVPGFIFFVICYIFTIWVYVFCGWYTIVNV